MIRAINVMWLLIISVILSILTGIAIFYGFEEKREAQKWVDHTNLVIDNTINLLGTLKETETSQRGYLITRDTSYLRIYQTAVTNMRIALRNVRSLTEDNPAQTELLDTKIKPIIEDRISEINMTIMEAQRSTSGFRESTMSFLKGLSKLETLQENITLLIRREQDLMKGRSAKLSAASLYAEQLIYLSLGLVTVISLIAFFTLKRINNLNLRMFEEQNDLNRNLEFRVGQQTSEIKKAYTELQIRNEDLASLNEELQASEEETKSSLDQLTAINRKLEDNEKLLISAKEQAEAATKAKSQFLSTMSHEIRTPMNAVIGLTHLLIQNQPNPDQTESLNLLKFSGENLLAIINDILDFSKIEADKLHLENITFDLHELVSTIIHINRAKARDKGIELKIDVDTTAPRIAVGDPVRLNQVITNLLSNAIKFTNEGFVELKIKSRNLEGDRRRITFVITDSGIGIPQEKIVSIFDSFSQANADITRKFGGTGLGLSISKRLVEMMGGEIKVQSVLNQGSTFEFSVVMNEAYELLEEKPMVDDTETTSGRKSKVLLVEDNHVNQIVATSFLKHWNIEADCVDNGLAALNKIKNKEYELVLMDLEMPELDGYSTTQEIRKMNDAYFRNIPILALTASAMSEVRERALKSGMNDLLTKPFNPDELHRKINTLIKLSGSHNVVTIKNNGNWSSTLDIYADGNAEAKQELTLLIIENLKELRNAASNLKDDESAKDYKRIAHKVKTSLKMLSSDALEKQVGVLNELVTKSFSEADVRKPAAELNTIIDALINEMSASFQ